MLQFANPALLFGALLLAVPLIIHLLNRRRNKRRPWAAMEFLLKAYRKQRRRLRRENLLLLLLRCLIPILLALAIARPSLRNAASLGASVGAAHHIFVFDRSYSMGLRLPGDTTPFERAKQLATLMVDGLTRRSSGQKVTIILDGLRPTIPLRDDLNLGRVKDRIAGLGTPLDTATDLTGALSEAADLVEDGDDTTARVYLFTDMQVRGFGSNPFDEEDGAGATPPRGATPGAAGDPSGQDGPDAAMFRDTARDAIRRIQEIASLSVLDVRSSSAIDPAAEENLQVVDVALGSPHAIARAAIPVRARLLNRSAVTKTVQATLEIDASQPQRQSLELEAGAEGEVTFMVTFRQTGQRRIRVEIASGDGLAIDDERMLVVTVRDRLSVLLVDGSDDSEPELRDATHLRRILDPTDGEGEGDPGIAPFNVRTTDTIRLLGDREPLDEDVIVLANVASLNERAAEKLRNAVRNGAGLFVMLGDRVEPASYNLHLHGAGDGIMPLQLIDAQGFAPGGDRRYGLEVKEPTDAVFADFVEPVFFQIFESRPVYRFIHSNFVPPVAEPSRGAPSAEGAEDSDAASNARVLATVRNPAESPLLVTRDYGFGKAAFLTSSISRRPDRWNGLDFEVTAFPLLHQLMRWLALPAIDPFNVQVGASLSATTEKRPVDLAAVLPERAGLSKVPMGEDPQPLMSSRYALPPFTQTAHAGFYTIEYTLDLGGGQQRGQQVFAVSPDVDEGDLRYYSHAAARNQLGIENISTDLPGDGEAAIQAGISELGPLFLWLTLGCVLAEAALARWVSGRRA